MDKISSTLLLLVILAIIFLIMSAIVMGLYNYTIPRLVMSINNKYNLSDFSPIEFGTACTLVLLCGILFGSSTVCSSYKK